MENARNYFEKRVETMGREELENLQLERLKFQLERCFKASDLYKAILVQHELS